jgi:CotH kinase protein/Lamin Tail Domain/Right handed beta helix region
MRNFPALLLISIAAVNSIAAQRSWAGNSGGRFKTQVASPAASAPQQPLGTGVVINEIMYHPYHPVPGAEDVRQEYIELFNRGAAAVNLAGWRLSGGVHFVFPDVTLGAGEYLVVAADVATFETKYPGVGNVVGNWQGKLSDSGETIELVDDSGVQIDRVHYADEGDWAVRELGPVDHGHRGWVWSALHDGGGKSLEMMNPALPNEYGQNWAASSGDGGTPGEKNSVAADDIAPMIVRVAHQPIIPHAGDSVTISARIIDDQSTGVTATLNYRVDTSVYQNENTYPRYDPASFTRVSMFDDGAHGDGVYGAAAPPQPDGTIIEFFIEATDTTGHRRTWPAASIMDGTRQQVTNAFYRVDNSFDGDTHWAPGRQPIYYLIMTNAEKGRLLDIGDREGNESDSNAQMNATFVSVDGVDVEVRHNVGVRNRGHGSRDDPPNNYRVDFPHDRAWKGVTAVDLNTKYTYYQLAGSVVFRLSGLAQPEVTAVQVRLNGENLAEPAARMYGSYAHLEVADSDFVKRSFPDDSAGNLYKCMRDLGPADLRYRGANPDSYRNSYFKKTNIGEDDWSDVIELCRVLSADTPDATYMDEVSRVINVDEWLRVLAVNALLDNNETTLANGVGDDYFLYRGVKDTRFVLIQHDLDTIFGGGGSKATSGIFRATGLAVMNRFLRQPEFVPRYYRQLRNLIQTTFNPEKLDPLLDGLLGDFVSPAVISRMKDFVAQRDQYVLSLIPSALTIESSLPQINGYCYSRMNNLTLSGTADAVEIRSVRVNGRPANWSAVDGRWDFSAVAVLSPGINRILVQIFDGTGGEMKRRYVDIWYDDGNVSQILGTLGADTLLDAASGPWDVMGDLVVPAGVTLTIDPGTTIYFEQGARLIINGRLTAEGTPYRRIQLTRQPGSSAAWGGLVFNSAEDNRLAYVDMLYSSADSASIRLSDSRLSIDNVTWAGTDKTILQIDGSSLAVRNCTFPDTTVQTVSGHRVLSADPYMIFENNTFGVCSGLKQDVVDFSTSGPNPVPQFIHNTFLGGGDDALDLDGTNAYIDGNVFENFHRNFDPQEGESYAVTTGYDGSYSSNHVIVRNLFVNCDNAILVKDKSWVTAENNTFVRCSGAAINFNEPQETDVDPGDGAYLDGNIFWDTNTVFGELTPSTLLTVNHSDLPSQWRTLGVGNIDADPLFVDPNGDFHLKSGSPAIGAGPCGLDMGAYVPTGAAICGEPDPITWRTDATLTVGGPGITAYKYSLNDPAGPWSTEQPVETPINLTGLQNGRSYVVYVIGKNYAGIWQAEDSPTVSRAWTVDASYSKLVFNEVLAVNNSAVEHEGTFPDIVELYYDGPAALDLSGIGITDDPQDPTRFVFPAGAAIQPGGYLVLYADSNTTMSGTHLGFSLDGQGEGLYLYDKAGALLDSVEFGLQIPDLSIGKTGPDGRWRLTVPTFGQANVAVPLGDPSTLKINEWLADGRILFEDDFIELYNPQPSPVDLSNLYLTDNPATQPRKCLLGPLSFIAGQNFAVLQADDHSRPGHLNFKLSPNGEIIALFDNEGNQIDQVYYGPQTTDVSQGRAPDGADHLAFFTLPTPGVANPQSEAGTDEVITLVPEYADKRVLVPTGNIGVAWRADGRYDDSGWLACTGRPGGVGYERSSGYESYLSLDLQAQMYNKNSSCYIRIPFTIEADALNKLTSLSLNIRYDDGFVAYLNGVEIARRNFSGTPAWNSRADASQSDSAAVLPEPIDVSAFISSLKSGGNVLAIQGLNVSPTSSDMLISAELDGMLTTPGAKSAFAGALELLAGLRVTELMYHASAGTNLDYIELKNVGETMLDLSGVRLSGGIDFTFGTSRLPAGQCVLVVDNAAAFGAAYGMDLPIAGEYSGTLSNGGEKIILRLPAPLDAAILRFEYSDTWYPTTDGGGDALVINDPQGAAAAWTLPKSWHPASPTPGAP